MPNYRKTIKDRLVNDREKSAVATIIVLFLFSLTMAVMENFMSIKSGHFGLKLNIIFSFACVPVMIFACVPFFVLMSKKHKKSEHGFGRIEYVASFTIAMTFFAVAIVMLIDAIPWLIKPTKHLFNWTYFGLIIAFVVVKLLIGIVYSLANRKIKSGVISALSIMSLFSAATTLLAFISYVASPFVIPKYEISIDVVITVVSFALIVLGGILISFFSLRLLLVKNSNPIIVSRVENILKAHSEIKAYMNLALHDYGYKNIFGTVEIVFSTMYMNEVSSYSKKIENEILRYAGVVVKVIPVYDADIAGRPGLNIF